jgi:hypothetical protein
MNAPVDTARRNRNRWMLVLVAAIFLGSAALAGALRFSGWRPEGMKNHGELLQPPADLRAMSPRLADGGTYAWRPVDRTWRILVAPRPGCGEPCVALSRDLDKVWQLFGREADRVDVLWLGPAPPDAVRNEGWRELAPDAALRAALPGVDAPASGPGAGGVPVYVVDPNGFVILRHAPGFDPAHLRQDMARLLKLK